MSPENQAIVGGLIRSVLAMVGAGGLLSGDQLGVVAGALAAVVSVAWGIWQKKHAAATTVSHATLTTAVQAAAAGTPADAADIVTAAKAGQF
jgi:hypothetical protein